jgi:hypothetical protein
MFQPIEKSIQKLEFALKELGEFKEEIIYDLKPLTI